MAEFNNKKGKAELKKQNKAAEEDKQSAESFKKADTSGDSLLDVAELKAVFSELSEKRIKVLISRADKDEDGMLSVKEFNSAKGEKAFQNNVKNAKQNAYKKIFKALEKEEGLVS